MGPSAAFHLSTERIEIMGSAPALFMFHVTPEYNMPPVSMSLEGKGADLESACGEITWQFLEKIGMPCD